MLVALLLTSSGYLSPKLTLRHIIAKDPSGNLRDPSAMIQDPNTLRWHFWVVFVPGSEQPGWAGYLHHYSSDSIAGPFVSHGLALNHSADPGAFDHHGMFSPSAVYDAASERWYLFYSGTGSNYTEYKTSAQLVASAAAPEGPWVREGVVAYPTGSATLGFNRTWNSRRVDSGRAVSIDGRRGYWSKGCYDHPSDGYCQEGAYFPRDASSWAPPYDEWAGNPVMRADGTSDPAYFSANGYENCEFFMGPARGEPAGTLHVLCQNHGSGQPHFVANVSSAGLRWTFVNLVDTSPAREPTPVYEGGPPGSEAKVRFFIARTESGETGAGALTVALYSLEWE